MKTATLCAHIPSTAAGTDDQWYVAIPWLGKWAIDYIAFAPATAVALHASNFTTVTISANDGSGGSDTTVATHKTETTGGTALVLKTTVAPTVTQPSTPLQRGHQIKIGKADSGTGAILDGSYTIALRKVG